MHLPAAIGERVREPGAFSSATEQLLFQRHLFAYEETLSIASGRKILEVGCGAAFGTHLLARTAASITALDIDAGLIAALQKNVRSDRIDYALYDGMHLPFEDHTFDLCVAFQVLEHVYDDGAFLRELLRVTRPNGKALITTPNRLLRLLPGQAPFNNFHVREYTADELEQMVQKLGYELHLAGVFGDLLTQAAEEKRLAKYHTWIFRHLFQRLPRAGQVGVKKLVQLLGLKRFRSRSKASSIDFRFVRRATNLEKSIDLWAEISYRSGQPKSATGA